MWDVSDNHAEFREFCYCCHLCSALVMRLKFPVECHSSEKNTVSGVTELCCLGVHKTGTIAFESKG